MATGKRSNSIIVLLGLATAVVGAVLAGLFLLGSDDDGGGSVGAAPGERVQVLVARRAIPRGTAGGALGDAVEVREVRALDRTGDAITSVAELADRTTTVDIQAGQQLRSSLFRQRTVRGEAITVPDGKQAVAITVPFTQAGAGYVGPGDRINLYALTAKVGASVAPPCAAGLCPLAPGQPTATSQLVLPNVEVLDVSQEIAPTSITSVQPTGGAVARAATSQQTVTYLLALDANQAEKAIFFSSYAEVYVTLVPKGQPDSTTSGRDQATALRP